MTDADKISGDKKTILVAEDEKDLLEAIVTILESEGFNVLQAQDGAIALEQAFKEKPDLIMLDIRMPKVDGLEFLRKLRMDTWGSHAKVIILTALSDMENISKAIEIGGAGLEYLIKTEWKLEDVVKRVKEKLEE